MYRSFIFQLPVKLRSFPSSSLQTECRAFSCSLNWLFCHCVVDRWCIANIQKTPTSFTSVILRSSLREVNSLLLTLAVEGIREQWIGDFNGFRCLAPASTGGCSSPRKGNFLLFNVNRKYPDGHFWFHPCPPTVSKCSQFYTGNPGGFQEHKGAGRRSLEFMAPLCIRPAKRLKYSAPRYEMACRGCHNSSPFIFTIYCPCSSLDI